MKRTINFKWFTPLFLIILSVQNIRAQTRADVFDERLPVTWLGIDYSQAKFIGSETAYKNSGELVNSEFVEKYIPAWNNFFLIEPKKYDVAKMAHRPAAAFALNVTEKVNSGIKKDFFTENPADFHTLTKENISELVKQYDFQGHTGIGILFFMEGMSKGLGKAGMWVTFVDMASKTVLLTEYGEGKTGGFGFKNYWANTIYKVVKATEDQYDYWKKH